jgi:hypothetical protein
MIRKLSVFSAAVVCCLILARPAAADLITNGGFETGDFTGWTEGGHWMDTYVEPNSYVYGAHTGNYYVFFGAVGADATISQTVTTALGENYTLSFWLAGNGSGYSDLNLYWDSSLIATIGSPIPSQPYMQYTYTVQGTGSDTLTFGLRNDPSYDALDDVSLTPASPAVPEPSGLIALAGLGGVGLSGLVWRRRKSA